MMEDKEIINYEDGIDIVKTIGAIFVLLLHVGGYVREYNSLDTYGIVARNIFYVLEAIAYPAIHLFVLAGSYLILSKGKQRVSIKSVVTIWSETFLVTFSGLIILTIVAPETVTLTGIIQSVFPFLGRAYWFVSDYIILLILAPLLVRLIESLEDKVLYIVTLLLFVWLSVFRTFLPGWGSEGNVALFVLLFFIAACFQRSEKIEINKYVCLCIWMTCVVLMVASVFCITLVANYVGALVGREEIFYHYNSIFVIGAAIGLFGFLKQVEVKKVFVKTVLRFASSNTLVVYLLHMHPIAKHHYTNWGLLRFVNVSGGGYCITVLATVAIAFIVLLVIGNYITKTGKKLGNKLTVLGKCFCRRFHND